MAGSKGLFLRTFITLVLAICLMAISILSVFGHTPKSRNINDSYLPYIDSSKFEEHKTREQFEKKFNVYTHLRESEGKSIATLYSSAQIYEIRHRRNNGEWFYLTDAEVLYLISDTISLFEKKDIVCIIDLNGVAHAYHAKESTKFDICTVIMKRLEVLCSAYYEIKFDYKSDAFFIMNESVTYVSQSYLSEMYRYFRGVYFEGYTFTEDWYIEYQNNLKAARGSAFHMINGRIYYVNELSKATRDDLIIVY
ncbi:MAG: hypothetical protein IJX51_01300 [Clostridia bacterium]|nr:hypothetical protein [Clostridia bacterium]